MLRFLRFLSALLLALSGAVRCWAENAVSAPAPVPAAGTADSLPPELMAELDALQRGTWHPALTARASVGWRDNILLSPFAPIERAFARGEIEALLLRPMHDRWEFVSFLNGDVLRYFSPPPETGGEQQWSLHTEARWQPVAWARLSLKATGYLRDMVIDLSETETRRLVAPTRVRGGYLTAAPRFTLPADFSLEPSVQVKRTDYRVYSGDHTEVRTGAKLEWRHGSALAFSAGGYETRRDYNDRVEFTAGGRPLNGTHLRFRQREGELKARSTWTWAGEWSATATAGRLENRDHASGYFDYNQKRARLEIGWHRAAWRLSLDADAKRMDYVVQTVGTGIAPPPRIADDFETAGRIERELSEHWTIFGEHRWERSRSNETDFSYRANTVLAGVQCSF